MNHCHDNELVSWVYLLYIHIPALTLTFLYPLNEVKLGIVTSRNSQSMKEKVNRNVFIIM